MPLPTLNELGRPGILNSIEFTLDATGEFSITHNPVGVEISEFSIPPFSWQTHGWYSGSGTMSLVSDGTTLLSHAFSFNTTSSCGGYLAASCTIGGTVTSSGNPYTTISDPSDQAIALVYSDLKIIGSLNDDYGRFHNSDYSAEWTFYDPLYVLYEFTPLSQVPIPAALPLFVSALGALGFLIRHRPVARKRTRRASCTPR